MTAQVPAYVAVRRPWPTLLALIAGTVLGAAVGLAPLPVTRIVVVEGSQLLQIQPSGAARLTVAIPAMIAAATWREPTGDLAVTASRDLFLARIAHLCALVTATAVASQLIAIVAPVNHAQMLANGLIFLSSALVCVTLFGVTGLWVIPAALLLLAVLPAPLPDWLGSWAYDGSTGLQRLLAASVITFATCTVATATAPHPLLRARSAAERNTQAST